MSLLETRGLSAFYGDFQALFGIDFTVAAGETVAIIGANGAGKTTLLQIGDRPHPRRRRRGRVRRQADRRPAGA